MWIAATITALLMLVTGWFMGRIDQIDRTQRGSFIPTMVGLVIFSGIALAATTLPAQIDYSQMTTYLQTFAASLIVSGMSYLAGTVVGTATYNRG